MSEDETTRIADDENATDNQQETNHEAAANQEDVETTLTSLELQLIAAKRQAQENLDGRQRALADFQNYKRRMERELNDRYQLATQDTLKQLLPIVDDFERGMANIPDEIATHAWMEGVKLISRKFQKLLDDYEVVTIDPVGEVFDPSRHEAVGVDQDSDVESGYVTVTLQKGYMSGDRVLRPAIVRVAG